VFKTLVLLEKLSIAFADHVIVANHIWHKNLALPLGRAGKMHGRHELPGYLPSFKKFGERATTESSS